LIICLTLLYFGGDATTILPLFDIFFSVDHLFDIFCLVCTFVRHVFMLLRHQAYGEGKHWARMCQGQAQQGMNFKVLLVDDKFRADLVEHFHLEKLINTVILTEVVRICSTFCWS